MGGHTAALQPAHIDSDRDDDDDGDDGSYTNYDVHGATHCGRSVFRGTARRVRGVRAGTLWTCALLRELREPRCCYGQCPVCRSNITMVMRIFM